MMALLTFSQISFGKDNTQKIRGSIVDKQSQFSIIGATVQIVNANASQGTKTDTEGKYILENVSPGRYEIKVTYMGYKEVIIPNVVVTSGKETIVDVAMEENVKSLKGTVIKASNKSKTINDLAAISARTFSMEEVNR